VKTLAGRVVELPAGSDDDAWSGHQDRFGTAPVPPSILEDHDLRQVRS
jgi:hypothetical protein